MLTRILRPHKKGSLLGALGGLFAIVVLSWANLLKPNQPTDFIVALAIMIPATIAGSIVWRLARRTLYPTVVLPDYGDDDFF
jgi:drug/metabolite transporter superfamily protein YnfA